MNSKLTEILERHSRYSAQYHFMLGDSKVSELYDLPANQAGEDMATLINMVRTLLERIKTREVVIGTVLYRFLKDCPEFQVEYYGGTDPIEISAINDQDRNADSYEKLAAALLQIANVRRLIVTETP